MAEVFPQQLRHGYFRPVFPGQLAQLCRHLLDESGTYGSKRKEILDSVSATVILDDYLAWRKDHPGEI